MITDLGLAVLYLLIPGWLILAYLIHLTATLFFKNPHHAHLKHLHHFPNALKVSAIFIFITVLVGVLTTYMQLSFALPFIIISMLIGMYYQYYKIDHWIKPTMTSLGIFVAVTLFLFFWAWLGAFVL